MATDLFSTYYNNPTKSYIYSNLLCNGASADEISFDITKDSGVISDNENTLSSIDFSNVHVPLTQYTRDMKTINPYGFIYVKGIDQGDSYTSKAYGVISKHTLEIEDWMYRSTIILHLKYVNELGNKVLNCITASGSIYDNVSVIENIQILLDEKKIPIEVKYDDKYIYLTSTTLGFEFWMLNIEMIVYLGNGDIEEDFPELFIQPDKGEDNDLGFGYDDGWVESKGPYTSTINSDTANAYTTPISETDYREIYNILGSNSVSVDNTEEHDMQELDSSILYNEYLFEDLTKYIPAHKYRNGAMKGCVIVATYPTYNADDITSVQRSLKLGFLKDRVEEFFTSQENTFLGIPMYVRVVRDVVDSYYSQYEYDIYNKWSNAYTYLNTQDGWIQPEEIPAIPYEYNINSNGSWSHSHVPNYYMLNTLYKDAIKYDAIGLYGYATYLSQHNGWETIGQLYTKTAIDDDESTNTYNLIPSFLIYNPNSFPVVVNYMTFA
jgi:hypothetical protein